MSIRTVILLVHCLLGTSLASEPPAIAEELTCFTGDGSAYRGAISVTETGKTCQMWASQEPHKHSRTPENYPFKGLTLNYCRNPDNVKMPWCYTTDPKSRWEYCKVPTCGNKPGPTSEPPKIAEELTCFTGDGSAYRGAISVTETGKTCQMWASQEPHKHSRTPENYPFKGLTLNYCRNPDNVRMPWCYTTDPKSRWEYCKVPTCGNKPGPTMECQEISGRLRQIDASGGQVFGVAGDDTIWTLYGDTWTQLPGALKHVTVGPSGVWGVNRDDKIYKLVGANWVQVNGLLKQVDAGGDQFMAGANGHDNIYCMGRDPTVGYRGAASPTPWNRLPGSLMYYSCGPNGCWGVNSQQNIYLRMGVTPTKCSGTGSWQHIAGKLVMVEVGTDGSVYGVNAAGNVYQRDGITASQPAGTAWTLLSACGKSKHVSYDLGHLWVITTDDRILDCTI